MCRACPNLLPTCTLLFFHFMSLHISRSRVINMLLKNLHDTCEEMGRVNTPNLNILSHCADSIFRAPQYRRRFLFPAASPLFTLLRRGRGKLLPLGGLCVPTSANSRFI